eukprot:jgi/Phyca11/562804/estExt2_Genewise1.C_PHYCAscaffold_100271
MKSFSFSNLPAIKKTAHLMNFHRVLIKVAASVTSIYKFQCRMTSRRETTNIRSQRSIETFQRPYMLYTNSATAHVF